MIVKKVDTPLYEKPVIKMDANNRQAFEKPDIVKELPKVTPSGIPESFQKVSMVKELTPAGKAALEVQNSGDIEYQKILKAGFESPKMTSSIVSNFPTPVAKNSRTDYLWSHPGGDKDTNLWSNVEFNKYGNNIQNQQTFFGVPAKFTMDEYGSTVVHSPPAAGLEMRTVAPTIHNFGFLDLEDSSSFKYDDNESAHFKVIDTDKEDIFAKYILDE